MGLPSESGTLEWMSMVLLEDGVTPPGPDFIAVEGARTVTWLSPIAGPAREGTSCTKFQDAAVTVEARGEKEVRLVLGDSYIGASTFVTLVGAFTVDGDVFVWLEREDRKDIIDLSARTSQRFPDVPKPLVAPSGKPSCPSGGPAPVR